MSEENTSTGQPPTGADIVDLAPTSPERLHAALQAGKAAAKAFAAQDDAATSAALTSTDETTEDAAQEPAEEPVVAETPLALQVKIKQREQRIREQAANKYAAREQQLAQREQQLAQQAARYEQLANLAKTDPAKLFEAVGFQEKDYIRQRLESGKPEAQITAIQHQLEQERQERLQLQQQIQSERQAQVKAQTHTEFQQLALDATKYPTVATVYEGATDVLIKEAYAVQDMFAQQHGRLPDLEEIAMNLEALEKQKAARYARLNGKAAPAATKPKSPKAIPGDISGRDQKDRATTPEERRARALAAGKKAAANFK